MSSPLDGVRVLDLSRLFPGAYCTALLAGMGADVLKVEAPGHGDGIRGYGPAHETLNAGKRSMVLDLRAPGSGEVLRALVGDAHVLVESHRPGALDELGLGWESLRAENERLVWCSLTGFGPDHELSRVPGHDLSYLGFSGLLSTFAVDGVPPLPGSTVSVAMAGALGAFGIVAALAGGGGRRVDATMTGAATWVIADQVGRGNQWPDLACRRNYRCGDGRWVTCTASEPRTWKVLVEALGLPDLAEHVMGDDEAPVIARLTAAFASAPSARWVEDPGPGGGIGPVLEPAEVAAPVPPLLVDGMSLGSGPAPALGQHSAEVLAALSRSGGGA